MRILTILLLFTGLGASAAVAQELTAQENGRYTMAPTKDGFVRLDTRTGTVSLCNRVDGRWSCGAISKEQSDLENEVVRLRSENARLRRKLKLAARQKQGTGSPYAPGSDSGRLELPSDEDVDRVLGFFERTMKRLKKMMKEIRKNEPETTPL